MTPAYKGERCKLSRIMSWVLILVWVMWQGTCCGWSLTLPNIDMTGLGVSPGCSCITLKSTVRRSIRGGVPVFKRSMRKGLSRRRLAKVLAGGSPALPPWLCCMPIWIIPPRKVPVVITTCWAKKLSPMLVLAPTIWSCSIIKSSTDCWKI